MSEMNPISRLSVELFGETVTQTLIERAATNGHSPVVWLLRRIHATVALDAQADHVQRVVELVAANPQLAQPAPKPPKPKAKKKAAGDARGDAGTGDGATGASENANAATA